MMRLDRTARSLIYGLILIITGVVLTPDNALAGNASLRIQDLRGKELTKPGLFGMKLMEVWEAQKPDACNKLAEMLSQPRDYSLYNFHDCHLGSVSDVQTVESLPDGFSLKATVDRSSLKADVTQPFVGQWADPSVDASWDGLLTVTVKYTDDSVCPGSPGNLPWFRFESAFFEVLSPDVDVHSTLADIVGGVIGFFSGSLFGGAAAIPLAVAGAFGTDAIIDGIAREVVPLGMMDFTDLANERLIRDFSPCELEDTFGSLKGTFQPRSLTPDLVTLGVTRRSLILSPILDLVLNGFPR